MFVRRFHVDLKVSLQINTYCIHVWCCWVVCEAEWSFDFQFPLLSDSDSLHASLSPHLSPTRLTLLRPLVHWPYRFFINHLPPHLSFSFLHNLIFMVYRNSLGNVPNCFWHTGPAAPQPGSLSYPSILPPLRWTSVVGEKHTIAPMGQYVTNSSSEQLTLTGIRLTSPTS